MLDHVDTILERDVLRLVDRVARFTGQSSIYLINTLLLDALYDCCSGECDTCIFRKRVPGDPDRIDREPRYYCGLFEEV